MVGRTTRRLLYVVLLLVGLGMGPLAPGLAAIAAAAEPTSLAPQAQRVLYVAEIDGAITPIAAQYLRRAISLAEREQAAGLLIRLDTPGGLDSAMRDIAQDLLGAQVPTIVYVAPPGARAASAGLFVTLAAHVAAMAPGTNIGAAHPVALGQGGQAAESTPLTKATEDAAALVRSLANTYGRNATWAERAVRESVAITATEAIDRAVVDFVATDVADLLRQVDGETVQVAGQPVTLQLSSTPTQAIAMTWLEQLLAILADPNIALILMSLGTLGLFAEMQHPGTVLPGVLGGGALILGLVALGNLPFNWAGLALLALAAILLIAEVFIAGFGAFGVGSIIAFVLGAILLFFPLTPPSPIQITMSVHPGVIASMAATFGAFVIIVVRGVLGARDAPIGTGKERLVGATGTALTPLGAEGTGQVRVANDTWSATLEPLYRESSISVGEAIEVTDVRGVTLLVRPSLVTAPQAKALQS
ncbi:MAG: peptidase [Dehalococcoidia bacterium]|nr:peptidase [Dehalococcoidia bacterium]